MLLRVCAITAGTRTSTSALRTLARGGLGCHAYIHSKLLLSAYAPRLGGNPVLPRGLWPMTEAIRRSPTRASSVGAACIKCE